MKTTNFHELASRYSDQNESKNQYLLVDSAGVPGVRTKLLSTTLEWCELFEHILDRAGSATPVIICTVRAGKIQISKNFCTWLASRTLTTSTVSFISTPFEMKELQRRLQLRTEAQLPGNVQVLLRFFDTRVFESLLSVLTPEQLDGFLGIAESWGYLNRQGGFIDREVNFAGRDKVDTVLYLDQEQEEKLVESAAVDQMIYTLRENAAEVINKIPIPQQYSSVRQAYELALKGGVKSDVERILCTAMILRYGSECEVRKEWQTTVDNMKAE